MLMVLWVTITREESGRTGRECLLGLEYISSTLLAGVTGTGGMTVLLFFSFFSRIRVFLTEDSLLPSAASKNP